MFEIKQSSFATLQEKSVDSKYFLAQKIFSIKSSYMYKKKQSTHYCLLVQMTDENDPAEPHYLSDWSDFWLSQEMCVARYFSQAGFIWLLTSHKVRY